MMKNSKSIYGKLRDGRKARLFTLKDKTALEIRITNFGGIITNIMMPDKYGKVRDIVLGYDTLDGYLENPASFGAVIGRVAGRISKARFNLDGSAYHLFKNDGENHLHGGKTGFSKKLWDVISYDGKSLKLHLHSPDGEEGYPGNVDVEVVYSLQKTNELHIEYFAESDIATPLNLTNHSYFNLSGEDNVLNHRVQIQSDGFLKMDDQLIPTGKIIPVKDTIFDLSTPKLLSQLIPDGMRGFDNYYVIENKEKELMRAAVAEEPKSGRELEIFTTHSGLVFYTANALQDVRGKQGRIYGNYDGLCFETQAYPDAVNRPEFPSVILYPNQEYHTKTIFRFSLIDR